MSTHKIIHPSLPPSPQIVFHNREGQDRELINIEDTAARLQSKLNNLASVRVLKTNTGSLATQAAPFTSAAVTLMVHGAALGMFTFVPYLSSWVDVTPAPRADLRLFVATTSADFDSWNIPVLPLDVKTIKDLEWLGLMDDGIRKKIM